ncbi:hypothetical protein BDN72DRAFT_599397 [Pluteus cervinus]|uniref:Uncharacterized protein n=1 Tax=Pluteus cervinus TaxID=181527 RepID=A0ACD3BB84_9AGAR|nr:hypothetical protein BDN72DRAFT_599397 [Pluteus cervinus]
MSANDFYNGGKPQGHHQEGYYPPQGISIHPEDFSTSNFSVPLHLEDYIFSHPFFNISCLLRYFRTTPRRLLSPGATASLPATGWILSTTPSTRLSAARGIPTRLSTSASTADCHSVSAPYYRPLRTVSPSRFISQQQPDKGGSSGGCMACLAGMCLCCCAEEICDCLF